MIKDLRTILAAAMLAVCGTTFAQDITAEPSESDPITIEFVDVWGGIEGENADKSVVYVEKHALENEAANITFKKGGAQGAPNYNIKNKYVILFGGSLADESATEGNTMTYTSDKYLTQINLVATKAKPWADIKANVGTITLGGANGRNVVWTNKDADGNTIDTKEVVFTACTAGDTAPDGEAQEVNNKHQLRYVRTLIRTSENTPTGITSVSAGKAQNGVRYNVAGQRVANSFKGLVIENGKKVVVK